MDRATILTVDDDAEIRQMVSDVLSGAGFRVLTAESGEAALDLLAGDQPVDMLFTDVVMSGLSGMELARRARRLRPGLRIIVASGYWPHIVTAEEDEALLSKPYNPAQLVTKVRGMLDQDPAQRAC
jgi:CheY-like chemotaxis protein